jgi:hypothetical protein
LSLLVYLLCDLLSYFYFFHSPPLHFHPSISVFSPIPLALGTYSYALGGGGQSGRVRRRFLQERRGEWGNSPAEFDYGPLRRGRRVLAGVDGPYLYGAAHFLHVRYGAQRGKNRDDGGGLTGAAGWCRDTHNAVGGGARVVR